MSIFDNLIKLPLALTLDIVKAPLKIMEGNHRVDVFEHSRKKLNEISRECDRDE